MPVLFNCALPAHINQNIRTFISNRNSLTAELSNDRSQIITPSDTLQNSNIHTTIFSTNTSTSAFSLISTLNGFLESKPSLFSGLHHQTAGIKSFSSIVVGNMIFQQVIPLKLNVEGRTLILQIQDPYYISQLVREDMSQGLTNYG